jgi:hypothetical protein
MYVIKASDALPPLPVFSQAVRTEHRHKVYVSGNIGATHSEDGGLKLVEGGVKAQTVSLPSRDPSYSSFFFQAV